jgi:hypothetical protein
MSPLYPDAPAHRGKALQEVVPNEVGPLQAASAALQALQFPFFLDCNLLNCQQDLF